MLTLLYTALFFAACVGLFSQKKYGNSVQNIADLSMYSLITGIIACAFFWCSGGFSLAYNGRTILYSAIYAGIVLHAQFLILILYQKNGIAGTTVINTSISLLLTWGLGLLLFEENFSIASALRCLFMLAAGILIARPGTGSLRYAFLAALLGLTEAGGTLLSKLFAADQENGLVTNFNSLFFLTNAFLIGFNFFLLIAIKRGNLRETARMLRNFRLKQIALIISSTLSSNMVSLLSAQILSLDTLSLFAPIRSALTLIAGFAVGRVFFREKQGILPAALAFISVLLGFIH